jgi:peptidoglycan hydrolase CwlO-like protein
MDLAITLDNIHNKVALLAQKLEKSQALNKELREEVRSLDGQLNDYTELIGSLEMEIVELKKGLEKKK